ncbi:MAG: DUF4390 domain-containing protein [Candidatus Eisenbacteria bacterium]
MPLARMVFAGLVAMALTAPAPARADRSLSFENIRAREGWIELDLRLEDGFSGKVGESLERGLPTTVTYALELWRSRSRWFDRLERTRYLVFRIERDVLSGVYRVRSADGGFWEVRTTEALEDLTLRPGAVRVAPLDRVDGRQAHYFSARARVKPLELEQIREIEAWLEGKIPGEEESDPGGGILGMPERVFGFVAGLAGLGEESIEARSVTFRPESLE